MRHLHQTRSHICASSIFGQIKNNYAGLPLGGAIRFKKHKNSYNYASVSPIELKIDMQYLCPICHKCIWGKLAYLKKHGRHQPIKFEHLLNKVIGGRSEMKLYGHVRLVALKVCKNFERNRPLVGANEFCGSGNHVSFNLSTQYAYHLIALLILSNFASRTIAVNQFVH